MSDIWDGEKQLQVSETSDWEFPREEGCSGGGGGVLFLRDGKLGQKPAGVPAAAGPRHRRE